MVRWLGMRSLADTRRSMGYQYSNSAFISSSRAAGMPELTGGSTDASGPLMKMKSNTSLVSCSAVMPLGLGLLELVPLRFSTPPCR